jgi:hypothetical protein
MKERLNASSLLLLEGDDLGLGDGSGLVTRKGSSVVNSVASKVLQFHIVIHKR